jgi:predicted O-methyltransferase YrrM
MMRLMIRTFRMERRPWLLIMILLMAAAGCKSRSMPATSASAPPPPHSNSSIDAGRYKFSTDWFHHAVEDWKRILAPLKGKPNLNYLEIGVFEGRSLLWMLENVLTDPTARATGIDIFPWDTRQTLQANLEASGSAHKVTAITGPSWQEMRKLPIESFDIIYIDGSHLMPDVLSDAVQGWALLKQGGLMIFDDYWVPHGLPEETNTVAAIDALITAHRNDVSVILRTGQVVLQKVANPCVPEQFGNREVCSSFEGYAFYWRFTDPALHDAVYKTVDGKRTRFRLTSGQRVLLEKILATRRFGHTEVVITDELRRDPDFAGLRATLDLAW